MNEHRNAAYKSGIGAKGTIVSKQRMETPVTYFYTDQERIVDVSVEFPKGLLTEFFPPVRQFGPDYKKGVPEPLTDSWLRWGKVRLIPEYKALNEKVSTPTSTPSAKTKTHTTPTPAKRTQPTSRSPIRP